MYNDSLTLPLPTNPTLVLDLEFEFYNDMKCSGKIGLIKTLRTVFFFNVLSTYKKSLMFVNLIINLVFFFLKTREMALICRIVSKRIARSFAMYLGQNSVQPTASQIHDYSIFFSHFSFFVVKYFRIFIFYL